MSPSALRCKQCCRRPAPICCHARSLLATNLHACLHCHSGRRCGAGANADGQARHVGRAGAGACAAVTTGRLIRATGRKSARERRPAATQRLGLPAHRGSRCVEAWVHLCRSMDPLRRGVIAKHELLQVLTFMGLRCSAHPIRCTAMRPRCSTSRADPSRALAAFTFARRRSCQIVCGRERDSRQQRLVWEGTGRAGARVRASVVR